MTAKAKQKESGSLSSRDLIALGVFSLLFMVVSMLVVGITSMSVVAYCGCCAIAAIPAGIVWVYMHARVPRAGTSLIMALVFAVVIFVIGSGWPVALGLAVGGAVSELARKALGYGRFAGVAVGYALFETCWAAGLFVPMFASQDYYRELMGCQQHRPGLHGSPSVHGDSRDVRDHRGRDLRGRHHRLAGRTGGVQEAPRARGNRLAPFFKAT